MAPSRRDVLQLIASSTAALAATRSQVLERALAAATDGGSPAMFAAYAEASGDVFGLGTIAEDGGRDWAHVCESRMHGGAVRPRTAELVVVARRPGTFFVVLDARDGSLVRRIDAAQGRHFFGHAVFALDGQTLFATEAIIETRAGLVGIYDAAGGYRRIGEWETGGVGPHELVLAADGRSLWIANGGIDTHPDGGRATLNEYGITSSLVRATLSGEIAQSFVLDKELQSLSIRHIALTAAGDLVFGCQDQADAAASRPLVGLATLSGACAMLSDGPAPWTEMRGYVGSVAFDAVNAMAVATGPRGNHVRFQSLGNENRAWTLPIDDVCGVATLPETGDIVLTTGTGRVFTVRMADTGPQVIADATHPRRWDNHIIR